MIVDLFCFGIFLWIIGTSDWKQMIFRIPSYCLISVALLGTSEGERLHNDEMFLTLGIGILLSIIGWVILKNKKEVTC